jgi:hypothetical protein
MRQGYYQFKMDLKDIEKTAFATIWGLFEYTRLPFGLKSAPATFSRIMNDLAKQCSCQILVNLDDIVICSDNEWQHLNDIEEFLKVVAKNDMTLHMGKCRWGLKEIKYIGYLNS